MAKPVNSGYSYVMGQVVGSSSSRYDFWLEYKITSQTSTQIKIKTFIYLQRNDGTSNSAYNLANVNYRRINDYSFNGPIDTRNNALVELANKEFTIDLATYQGVNYAINGEFFINGVNGISSGSVSANVKLSRPSTVFFDNFTLDYDLPITINSSNVSYTHDLNLFADSTEILVRSNVGTSLTIQFSEEELTSIYDLIDGTDSIDITIVCSTYLGETFIGETSTTKRGMVDLDNASPVIQNPAFLINPNKKEFFGDLNFKGVSKIGFYLRPENIILKAGALLNDIILEIGNYSETVPFEVDLEGNLLPINILITSPADEDSNEITLKVIDNRGLIGTTTRSFQNSNFYTPFLTINTGTSRRNAVEKTTYLKTQINCWLGSFETSNGTKNIEIGKFEYSTNLDFNNYIDVTSEVKSLAVYDSERKTLTIDDLPIHENLTSGGFPLEFGKRVQFKFNLVVKDGINEEIVFNQEPTLYFVTDGKVSHSLMVDEDGTYCHGYNGMPISGIEHTFHGTVLVEKFSEKGSFNSVLTYENVVEEVTEGNIWPVSSDAIYKAINQEKDVFFTKGSETGNIGNYWYLGYIDYNAIGEEHAGTVLNLLISSAITDNGSARVEVITKVNETGYQHLNMSAKLIYETGAVSWAPQDAFKNIVVATNNAGSYYLFWKITSDDERYKIKVLDEASAWNIKWQFLNDFSIMEPSFLHGLTTQDIEVLNFGGGGGGVPDTGWVDASLTSDFKPYNNDYLNQPRYRKIGNVVYIRGIVSPTASLSYSTSARTIFALPSDCKPLHQESFICQGSGKATWQLGVMPNGNVTFARYGAGTGETASTTAWLIFSASFAVA